MTITSADEFVRLRTSESPEDYRRAASEDAPLDVWYAVIADHPEMRFWVAQNKTVPTAVLELLSEDADHGLTLFHRARPPPLLEV